MVGVVDVTVVIRGVGGEVHQLDEGAPDVQRDVRDIPDQRCGGLSVRNINAQQGVRCMMQLRACDD